MPIPRMLSLLAIVGTMIAAPQVYAHERNCTCRELHQLSWSQHMDSRARYVVVGGGGYYYGQAWPNHRHCWRTTSTHGVTSFDLWSRPLPDLRRIGLY